MNAPLRLVLAVFGATAAGCTSLARDVSVAVQETARALNPDPIMTPRGLVHKDFFAELWAGYVQVCVSDAGKRCRPKDFAWNAQVDGVLTRFNVRFFGQVYEGRCDLAEIGSLPIQDASKKESAFLVMPLCPLDELRTVARRPHEFRKLSPAETRAPSALMANSHWGPVSPPIGPVQAVSVPALPPPNPVLIPSAKFSIPDAQVVKSVQPNPIPTAVSGVSKPAAIRAAYDPGSPNGRPGVTKAVPKRKVLQKRKPGTGSMTIRSVSPKIKS